MYPQLTSYRWTVLVRVHRLATCLDLDGKRKPILGQRCFSSFLLFSLIMSGFLPHHLHSTISLPSIEAMHVVPRQSDQVSAHKPSNQIHPERTHVTYFLSLHIAYQLIFPSTRANMSSESAQHSDTIISRATTVAQTQNCSELA